MPDVLLWIVVLVWARECMAEIPKRSRSWEERRGQH